MGHSQLLSPPKNPTPGTPHDHDPLSSLLLNDHKSAKWIDNAAANTCHKLCVGSLPRKHTDNHPGIVIDGVHGRTVHVTTIPSCVDSEQPRQQQGSSQEQEARGTRSFVWSRQDVWKRSQGSGTARKGEAVVSGWSDAAYCQAWAKGVYQPVRFCSLCQFLRLKFLLTSSACFLLLAAHRQCQKSISTRSRNGSTKAV